MKTKILSSFKRACALGWKNFSREKGLSFVASFVLMIAITLAVSIFLIRGVANIIIEDIEEKADITIDFEVTVPEERIFEVRDEILEKFEVNDTEYVSREEAKTAFIQKFGNRAAVMESLEELGNPFSASLNIKASDSYTYQQISGFLEENHADIIYNIDFYHREEVIAGIFAITENARKIGFGVSIVLGIIAIMLVYNTIKLAIYGLKDEIHVMRLVGSSNLFIQGSFIVQGVLLGLASAFGSFTLLVIVGLFIPQTYNITFEVNLYQYFASVLPLIVLMQFAIGIVLGVLSSIIATAKYLK
jgi:cell division transport system permease protein